MIQVILIIAALVSFFLAALGVSTKINLVALGLFFWLLSQSLGLFHR